MLCGKKARSCQLPTADKWGNVQAEKLLVSSAGCYSQELWHQGSKRTGAESRYDLGVMRATPRLVAHGGEGQVERLLVLCHDGPSFLMKLTNPFKSYQSPEIFNVL
jgi:hypothetical protein